MENSHELILNQILLRLEQTNERLARLEQHEKQMVIREAYSVAQAAQRLNLSVWTVRQACNTKRIHAVKCRNRRDWRIPHAELMRAEAEGL